MAHALAVCSNVQVRLIVIRSGVHENIHRAKTMGHSFPALEKFTPSKQLHHTAQSPHALPAGSISCQVLRRSSHALHSNSQLSPVCTCVTST